MIKRIISLFIILAMLGSVGVVSADTANSVNEYEKTRTLLEAIGVFERYDTPGKAYEDTVTRAELITMYISVAFPELKGYKLPNSPFADVNTSDAAYEYICAATELGIISGNGSGSFRPGDAVTYNEALKIAISLLGYDMVAAAKGGFPAGYHTVAGTLDLNVGIEADAYFSYGDSLVLLLNALNTEVNEISAISVEKGMTYQSGETLLYNAFKIRRGEGILTENSYTTLTAPKDHDNEIVIGDFKGKIYGGVNAENYLGYEVEYYYQEDEKGDFVLYLEPTSSNKVTYISWEDAITVSDRSVSYYSGERKDSETIPGSAKVIYNGKAYPDYTMDIFKTPDADFRLIDNDRNGKIDVVNVTAWSSIYIDGIDTENERLIDKYDNTSLIELEDAKDWIIWNTKFEQLTLSQLTTGVVGNFVKSRDGQYGRIIIVDNKKSGTVDSRSDMNGNIYLSLDGTEYIVSDSYLKKVSTLPAIGTKATFCLDYTGRIAAIEDASDDMEYGYIIAAGDGESALDANIRIKMMKSNGTVAILDTDENLKVDGEKYTDSMFDTLSKPQIIRYKLTGDDVLKEIDTVNKTDSEGDATLRTLTPKGTMKYYPVYKIFAGSFHEGGLDTTIPQLYCTLIPDSNTKLYMVPNESEQDVSDEDYMVTSLSYLTANAIKVFQGFNANPDSYIPDVVYMVNEGGGNLARGHRSSIVTKVVKGLNSEGEAVTKLKLVTKTGEETTLAMTKELESQNLSIEIGDFINYTVDMRNDISDINIIYSAKLRGFHPDNKFATEYFGSEFNPHCGRVYDRAGNILVLRDDINIANNKFVSLNNVPIYVVDNSRNGTYVKKGTIEDIYDVKHFGEDAASDIFYYTWQTAAQMLVVYR